MKRFCAGVMAALLFSAGCTRYERLFLEEGGPEAKLTVRLSDDARWDKIRPTYRCFIEGDGYSVNPGMLSSSSPDVHVTLPPGKYEVHLEKRGEKIRGMVAWAYAGQRTILEVLPGPVPGFEGDRSLWAITKVVVITGALFFLALILAFLP